MDKPLTKGDCYPGEGDFLIRDVQSAKRLLKQRVWHSSFIEHLTERQQEELRDIIDACFQIDDGKE